MIRLIGLVAAFTLALTLAVVPATAETRVAFIVGNSDYTNAGQLRNPVADARLIARTLEGLGFVVEEHENLTRDDMGRALAGFLANYATADVTLFYYAGHGMQFDGKNYLVGTDAELKSEFDIEGQTLSLDRITAMIGRQSRAALIFIDACRDNPLADAFYRKNFSETRAVMSRGLAQPVAGSGSMVVFSASAGQVAYDGTGDNSAFAESLARHLPEKNVEILSLMKRVIGDVRRETGDRQIPIVTNDLVKEIYLNLGAGGEGAAIAMKEEQAVFDAAMEIGTARAWDIYLRRYPSGSLREMALAERDRVAAAELAQASGTEFTPGKPVEIARKVAEEAEAQLGLAPDDIKAVQEALVARGYDAGTPDGRMGLRTRQALADFQAATELPITGLITAATAERLGVTLSAGGESGAALASSANARRYDPDALALVEDDKRLIEAARKLKGKEFTYGFFEGRLYIGLLVWNWQDFDKQEKFAESLGGHLATLTSAAENTFAFNLVSHDRRFWKQHPDGRSTFFGPTFGLRQLPDSAEPGGGWVWVTGEPVAYTNWRPGSPINADGNSDYAAFMWDIWPKKGDGKTFAADTWHDFPAATQALLIEIE